MRSLGFRRLEGRPTERRQITLLAVTVCLHVLFWSSLLPFVTMIALFGAHNMDSTVLPSAILTIISAVLSICYLILHSFISRRQHAWAEEETVVRRVSIICDVAYRTAAVVPIFWFLTTIWNIIIAVRQPLCLLTESAGTSDQEFWRIGSACAAVRSSVAISLIALISSCTLFTIISKVRRPFEASLFGSCFFVQKRKLPSLEYGTRTVAQEAPPSRHDSEKSLARSIVESTPGPSFPSTPRTMDVDLRSGLGIDTPSARTPPMYGLRHQTAKRTDSTNSLLSVSTVIHHDGTSQNGQPFSRHANYGSPVADSAWRAMHPHPPGSTRSLPFYNLPVNVSRANLVHSMGRSYSSISIYESPSEIPSSLQIRTPSGPPPQVRPSVRPVRPSPALLSLQHRAARQRPLGSRPRTSPGVSGGLYACSSAGSTASLSSLGSRRCSSSPLSMMVRACDVEVGVLRGKLKDGQKDKESNWVREDSGISVSGSSTDGRNAVSSASDREARKKMSDHRAKRSISAPLPLRLRRSIRPEQPPLCSASPPSPEITPIPRRTSREQRSQARSNVNPPYLLPPWDPKGHESDRTAAYRPVTPSPSVRGARELRASLSRLLSKHASPATSTIPLAPSSSSFIHTGSTTSVEEPSFLEAVLAAGHVTPLLTSAGFASQRSSIRAALSGRGSSRRSQKNKTQDQTPMPVLPSAIPGSSTASAFTRPRGESIEHLCAAFGVDGSIRDTTTQAMQSQVGKRQKGSGGTVSTTDYTANPNNNRVSTTASATANPDANTKRQSKRPSASVSLRSSLADWMIKERQSQRDQRESQSQLQLREASVSDQSFISSTETTATTTLAIEYARSESTEGKVPVEICCSGVREASVVGDVGLGLDVADGKL